MTAQRQVNRFSPPTQVRSVALSRARTRTLRVSQLRPAKPHQVNCTGILSPISFRRYSVPEAGSLQKLKWIVPPGAASPSSAEYQCAIDTEQLMSEEAPLRAMKGVSTSPTVPRSAARAAGATRQMTKHRAFPTRIESIRVGKKARLLLFWSASLSPKSSNFGEKRSGRSFADMAGPGLQCSRSLPWLRPASEREDN